MAGPVACKLSSNLNLTPSVFARLSETSLLRQPLNISRLGIFTWKQGRREAGADARTLFRTSRKRKFIPTVVQAKPFRNSDKPTRSVLSSMFDTDRCDMNLLFLKHHKCAGNSSCLEDFHDSPCYENIRTDLGHSPSVLINTHHYHQSIQTPGGSMVGSRLIRAAERKAQQFQNVRKFSRRRREYHDNEEEKKRTLRGAVMYIPNPATWISNKWNTVKLRRKFDPGFSEKEFLYGASQAISLVTHKVSKGDFKTLSGLVVEEVIDWMISYSASLSQRERGALALDLEDMALMKIRYVHLDTEQGKATAYVDSVCFGLKVSESVPYLIDLGIRFMRDYSTDPPGDWIVAGVTHIRLQNLAPE